MRKYELIFALAWYKKMKNKILHIMVLDKFIPPFIDFIQDNFDIKRHRFVIIGAEHYNYGLTKNHPVEWLDKKSKIFRLIKAMNKAEKIILHGLWSELINKLLFLQPWLLKKCYWLMWGGDFYFPETQSRIKKQIIKRIGYLVNNTTGDYTLVKEMYNAKGKHIKCFSYPSNIYKEYDQYKISEKKESDIYILMGNSSDPTNDHYRIFDILKRYKNEKIKIYCPLSYGDDDYAMEIAEIGKEIFGKKFVPLMKFMSSKEYFNLLTQIDIAIFAHKRQQAVGNIITLIGFGKKVYINKESTIKDVFIESDVIVYDIDKFDLKLIHENVAKKNINNTAHHFSSDVLIDSFKCWMISI